MSHGWFFVTVVSHVRKVLQKTSVPFDVRNSSSGHVGTSTNYNIHHVYILIVTTKTPLSPNSGFNMIMHSSS